MFDAAEMNELARRKRLLVAESDLNRQALKLEAYQIRTSLAGVTELVQSGRSVWRVLALAAPLAGFFVSRKRGKLNGLVSAALAGWRVFNRIQPLWQSFKHGREAAAEPVSPAASQEKGGI